MSALDNFTATATPEDFDRKYKARSRFFQSVGRAGSALAEAYAQADSENQADIANIVIAAMLDALRAHEGYRDQDIADVLATLKDS